MSSSKFFGHVPGYPPGSTFRTREELFRAGVHRHTQAGISGNREDGADSIVLSGGYVDDVDYGTTIVYTGEGGNNRESRRQIDHQDLVRGNRALVVSKLRGLPVRVIRGANHRGDYSPKEGYRYDGLYQIESFWLDKSADGFLIWRFHLEAIEGESLMQLDRMVLFEEKPEYKIAPRQFQVVNRIIRDSEVTRAVKMLYKHRCQVCGTTLNTPVGPYAEAAHIQPLGAPHNGPDMLSNVLCLCANHHVLFDWLAFTINDDFTLAGMDGLLVKHPDHDIDVQRLQFHRGLYRALSSPVGQ